MIGSIVRRKTKSGTVRYCAVWRVGARQKWKSFGRRRDAEGYLTRVVKAVQEGSYQDIR